MFVVHMSNPVDIVYGIVDEATLLIR